jgi:hypothetical protein
MIAQRCDFGREHAMTKGKYGFGICVWRGSRGVKIIGFAVSLILAGCSSRLASGRQKWKKRCFLGEYHAGLSAAFWRDLLAELSDNTIEWKRGMDSQIRQSGVQDQKTRTHKPVSAVLVACGQSLLCAPKEVTKKGCRNHNTRLKLLTHVLAFRRKVDSKSTDEINAR